MLFFFFFFFSSRRRHTRFKCDWSSDVCSSDLHLAHHARQSELTPIGPGGPLCAWAGATLANQQRHKQDRGDVKRHEGDGDGPHVAIEELHGSALSRPDQRCHRKQSKVPEHRSFLSLLSRFSRSCHVSNPLHNHAKPVGAHRTAIECIWFHPSHFGIALYHMFERFLRVCTRQDGNCTACASARHLGSKEALSRALLTNQIDQLIRCLVAQSAFSV